MVVLNKGQQSKVVLVLSGLSSFQAPGYLFKFTSEFNPNADPVYLVSPDVSPYPNRYNLFLITEGDGADVDLPQRGQYEYSVFAFDIDGAPPVDETGLETLEVGICTVLGDPEETIPDIYE